MKKVTVKTELIKKALPKLGTAISSRTVLPALENIFCKAEGALISLVSCDTEMTVMYDIAAEVEEPVEFLLHYHLFNNIAKICNEETIEFEVLKTAVKVKTGSDVFTLKFNSKIEEYPTLKKGPSANKMAFDDLDLPVIIAAAESVGNDKLRPALTRVCLDIKTDGMSVVGSNSWILYKHNLPTRGPKDQQLLISPRMIKSIEDLEGINIRWDDQKFSFESGDILIVINQPEYRYVDYNSVIKETEPNLKVKKESLIQLFKKMSVSPDRDVVLNFTPVAIKAESNDKNSGIKINSEIPCEYTGQTEQIVIDSENALKLLHQSPCNNLEISITSPTAPVFFRGEDPSYLSLIIPTFSK